MTQTDRMFWVAPPVVPERRAGTRNRRLPGLRAVAALAFREMSTSYGRSPGGYLWAVLEPLAGIAILTAIFSAGFRSPPVGSSFALFYATGLVPFLFYSDLAAKLAQSILYSRPLLAYPAVTFADALLARFLIAAMTQVLVAYIVFAGILLVFDTRTLPDVALAAGALGLAAALAFGVGTMNCFLSTRFGLWQRLWTVANRPLFLMSCVFFTFASVPEPFRSWLWFNPLVHVAGLMRRAFYPGYDASYVSLSYVLGLSLGLGVLGLVLLRRFHREMIHA